ncbi:F-box only protein 15 isoform X2 [Oncorhynchus kisutch]|uniref:F-box only protein 15 isoform X2 n=1 Tax=Oncorhynchus kisutch TaxID=8019 RepID=UPI0012DF6EF2|nr:F-box only protein 15 isoform X2 [Oncorhynchus kisutch]
MTTKSPGTSPQRCLATNNEKRVPLTQKKATVPSCPVPSRVPTKRLTSLLPRSTRHAARPAGCTQNHIEQLPPEILMKILWNLDASSLYCIGYVNKLLYKLAKNNAMWRKIYSAKYGESKKLKAKHMDEVVEKLSVMKVQERPGGYWRRLYFRTVAGYNHTKWLKELRTINRFTGLPSHTERVLRPGWRSLMAQLDIDTISKSSQVIGGDRLVKLVLLSPGIVIGIWRGQSSIAFVMATFHYHRLLERSLLGSSVCPYTIPENRPLFDDVDPNYGLHGYTLHITLHNTVTEIMSGHFPQLFCRKGQINEGFIQLNAIIRSNQSRQTPLSARVSLPWRSDALEGTVKNCCMMSLTLLDESQIPFWCVSTPVSMVLANEEPFSYDYQGQHFLIKYKDAEGKVQMDVVLLEEQRQFFLINLVVYISTVKVNQHFGRAY